MHNEQSSHVKARFGTTQRARTAQQMQSTPSRPNRDGVSASQQGGASQFPVDVNYAYTPSRSPTKKGAATTGRTRIGSMGPPPVPDLNAGFMTPKPLTTSSRKARVSDGKSKSSATNQEGSRPDIPRQKWIEIRRRIPSLQGCRTRLLEILRYRRTRRERRGWTRMRAVRGHRPLQSLKRGITIPQSSICT